MWLLLTLSCLVVVTRPAAALDAGTMDPRFGSAGIVPAACSLSCRFAVGCCTFTVQSDGRILLAEPGPGASTLRRLLPDGGPDPSFTYDGTVEQAIDMPVVVAVATAADGRVFVGTRSADASQGGIVVLQPNGERDAAWGDGGVLTAALLGGIPADMDVAPDGGLLVSLPSPDNPLGVVVRYGVDGVRDESFGGDGTADVPPTPPSKNPHISYPNDAAQLTVLPDGSFATETVVFSGGGAYFYDYVRFDPAGTVDPGFGVGGHLALWPPSDEQSRVLLGPAHALVAGRVAFLGTDVLVYRADLSGSLDRGFGIDGTVTVVIGRDAGAIALLEDAEGRPVFCGSFDREGVEPVDTPFVARLTAAGSRDPSFGRNGVAVVPDMPGLPPGDAVTAMAMTSDGDILALTRAGLVRLLGAGTAPPTSSTTTTSMTSTSTMSTPTTSSSMTSTSSTLTASTLSSSSTTTTTTTVTTTSSAPSTTLVPGCETEPVGPTFGSLSCRLTALLADLEAAAAAGRLGRFSTSLPAHAAKAKERMAEAEAECATSDIRKSRARLAKSIRAMIRVERALAPRRAKRSVDITILEAARGAANGIRADMRTLRRALACPVDAGTP